MKRQSVLMFVMFFLSLSAQAQTAPWYDEVLKLEALMKIDLASPNGQTSFNAHLQTWTTLVEQIKANPEQLENEIQSLRTELDGNLQAHQGQAQFRALLDRWNGLVALQARLGLAILKLEPVAPTQAVKVYPTFVSENQTDSLDAKKGSDDQVWTSLRQAVLESVPPPDFSLIYPGNTATEILESAKQYVGHYLAGAAAAYNLDVKAINRIAGGRQDLIMAFGSTSNANLLVGQVSVNRVLRTSADAEAFQQQVYQMMMKSRWLRTTNNELVAQSRSIGLKMELISALWLAEALDIAQIKHDPIESELRLGFEYSIQKLTKEMIAVQGLSKISLQAVTSMSFAAIKKALRTDENQEMLTAILHRQSKTLLPPGYSEAKMNAPWAVRWTFLLDFPTILRQIFQTRHQAGLMERIANKSKCNELLSAPQLRGN